MITTKQHKEISKLEKRIISYEVKISEVNDKFNSKELSEKRRDYFLLENLGKMDSCKTRIEKVAFEIKHLEQCSNANIREELLNFKTGPLTVFIKGNMSFWREMFPNYKGFIKEIKSNSENQPFLIDTGDTKQGALIGTATDLLLGYMVGNPLVNSLFRTSRHDDLGFLSDFILCFFYRIKDSTSLSIRPSEWKYSDLIIAFIICLAKNDIGYRTSQVIYKPDLKQLKKLDPLNSSFEDIKNTLSEITDSSIVNEIKLLGDSLFEILPRYKLAYYNPNFDSYGPIKPSDGDIILDETLYDLKCLSPQSKLNENYIFQIIGYYLLAKLTGFKTKFNSVGIINPRNKFKFVMNIDELVKSLGAESIEAVLHKFDVAFQLILLEETNLKDIVNRELKEFGENRKLEEKKKITIT